MKRDNKAGISAQEPYATKRSELILRAIVDEAHMAAANFCAFIDPRQSKSPKSINASGVHPVSLDLALRICVALRTRGLDQSGMFEEKVPDLPNWREVMEDCQSSIGGDAPRFNGAKLVCAVLEIRITRLSWQRIRGYAADVRVTPTDVNNMAKTLAKFLWRHRQLANEEGDNARSDKE